jgi:DNA-binding response OmpR family regulator
VQDDVMSKPFTILELVPKIDALYAQYPEAKGSPK